MENVNNSNENVKIKRDYVMHRRASVRLCKDCGKFYVISDNDIIHYVTKYNNLPQRCPDCREKVRRANPYPQPIVENDNVNNNQ